jgi:hypothetical protein
MEIYLDSNKIKTTGFEAIKDFLAVIILSLFKI